MIQVNNISKSYKDQKALHSATFDVNKAELFGLIGPDGAGKTTLMRILITLLRADTGEAFMNGLHIEKDFRKIRTIVGYMPGRFSLYPDLSVMENLHFFASVFETTIQENYLLIKPIFEQIEAFKDRKAGKLSGGMKQKLALSCALIHRPEILILDEPTTGVDAVSRKEFWEILKQLQQHGITILVSTPYMDEAALCDRVALIQEGRLLDINPPEKLVKEFPKKIIQVRSDNMFKLLGDLRRWEQAESVYSFGQYAHFTGIEDKARPEDLVSFLQGMGHADITAEEITPGIEDVFMEMMEK